MATQLDRVQSLGEEVANGITHGVGAALAIAALVYLATWAALYGDAWRVVGVSIYGTTLVLVYLASTLYHSLPYRRAKDIFQVLDHAAIYAFIAGCYTPFALVNLRGPWGWSLLGVVWGMAIVGIVLDAVFRRRFEVIGLLLYLAMGWLMVVASGPMLDNVDLGGIAWLVGGGFAYSVGVVFFRWESLRFHHAIWHVFVLAGSLCHFQAISGYVLPMQ
jgi:hemolysin III